MTSLLSVINASLKEEEIPAALKEAVVRKAPPEEAFFGLSYLNLPSATSKYPLEAGNDCETPILLG